MSQSQTMTNGDASSKLIEHLTSYPVVSDGISTFKSNAYGKQSLDIGQAGYNNLVAPLVPYAKGPYGYVAPYVAKADELASDGLTKVVDNNFPIVKEDTEKIKGTVMDFAYMPFRLVDDGKNYLLDTYSSEYKKCGGDGMVSGVKALITSGIVVTSDSLAWLSSFLAQKKDEGQDFASKKYGQGKQFAGQKYGQAGEYAHKANNFANQKADEAKKYASEYSEEAKNFAYMKGDEAKNTAKNAKYNANAKADQTKETVKEKSGSK